MTGAGYIFAIAFAATTACSSSSHITFSTSDGGDATARPSAEASTATKDGAMPDGGAGSQTPVDVPITLSTPTSKGTVRFTFPITLGSTAPVTGFLDTGSSGIRILPGVIPDSAFAEITETVITASYHSGLLLTGVVATIPVSLGGVATPAAIPVMLVRSISCEATEPNCGVAGYDAGNYTFFDSARVLVGVGLRNSPSSGGVASPMSQLRASPGFVIQGAVHGGASATMRLFPAASQIASFKTYRLPVEDGGAPLPNGVAPYSDRYGLPACLDDKTSGTNYCLGAELDTGNPPVYIEWAAADDAGESVLPSGTAIQVTIGPDSGILEQYAFTVGSPPTAGVDEIEVEPATLPPYMNLGTQVFFRYDIYFDPLHGVVGFASR